MSWQQDRRDSRIRTGDSCRLASALPLGYVVTSAFARKNGAGIRIRTGALRFCRPPPLAAWLYPPDWYAWKDSNLHRLVSKTSASPFGLHARGQDGRI